MPNDQILVVDDNLSNSKLAAFVLRKAGFEVQVAHDAFEALALLERELPRLILMDIQMPGMSGYELTRRLKADPRTQHVLVVALTALAMKGDEELARDAGCDGYISKPIDTHTLPQQVAGYLADATA
jgi:CheY-like chemotaxis protein